MKVLIGCEFSGIIRTEFRKMGHHAYSCDILPSEDKSEFHLQCDVLQVLQQDWDLAIFHPPCTNLAVSGARFFKEKIADGRQQGAIDFFMQLVNAPIEKICVENPVCIMSRIYRKPDQIIQALHFGHPTTKATCLWLKNLPKLKATNIVKEEGRVFYKSGNISPSWHAKTGGGKGKQRSITFKGIAQAMAQQWGA